MEIGCGWVLFDKDRAPHDVVAFWVHGPFVYFLQLLPGNVGLAFIPGDACRGEVSVFLPLYESEPQPSEPCCEDQEGYSQVASTRR